MSLPALNSFLVPNEVVSRWKEAWVKQGGYEIKEKQNSDKKAEAAFRLSWFPFYEALDL
jgi:hypothetical protein